MMKRLFCVLAALCLCFTVDCLAEEYLAFIKDKADAIKVSLEQEVQTQTEMNQQSESLRALWDEALDHLLLKAENTLSKTEMENLTAEQNAWEAGMTAAVETAGKEFAGGSMYPLVVNTEAARLTEERVYQLFEFLK